MLAKFNDGGLEGKVVWCQASMGIRSNFTCNVQAGYLLGFCVLPSLHGIIHEVEWCMLYRGNACYVYCAVYCKGVLWIVYCKGIVDLPDQCPSLGTTATNEALSDPPATT